MSSIRNATDGQQMFRNALAAFETTYRPRLDRIRQTYSANPSGELPAGLGVLLEAHGRNYVINALLAALNWNISLPAAPGATNLVPEAPIPSVADGETRYLDYLGLEQRTERPLLIVEAKRPGSPLPRRKKSERDDRSPAKAILAGLKGDELLYDWDDWLKTLRDYFRSVRDRGGVAPRRVLMTDGTWCIVFLAPETTLLAPEESAPAHIAVYESRASGERVGEAIDARFNEIYSQLAYAELALELEPMRVANLGFHIPRGAKITAMRGLHLLYVEDEELYSVKPKIQVSPLLFLRGSEGPWLTVESRDARKIPIKEEDLPEHLNEICMIADRLSTDAAAALATTLIWVPIVEHYANGDSFELLPGVKEMAKRNEFVIVTGEQRHYLREEPTVPNCPFHNWTESLRARTQWPEASAVSLPSVHDRAFFATPTNHHCSHSQVHRMKSEPITSINRSRCGTRSGKDQAAFCEIWSIEHFLCCRTCIFEEICDKAVAFRLPCTRAGRIETG